MPGLPLASLSENWGACMTRSAEPELFPVPPPHPSFFIKKEMRARGWNRTRLAYRMGGDVIINRLSIELYFEVGPTEPNLRIGSGEDFGRAFGVPAEFFLNLERAWLQQTGVSA
jgi:hypothetical protein